MINLKQIIRKILKDKHSKDNEYYYYYDKIRPHKNLWSLSIEDTSNLDKKNKKRDNKQNDKR